MDHLYPIIIIIGNANISIIIIGNLKCGMNVTVLIQPTSIQYSILDTGYFRSLCLLTNIGVFNHRQHKAK